MTRRKIFYVFEIIDHVGATKYVHRNFLKTKHFVQKFGYVITGLAVHMGILCNM